MNSQEPRSLNPIQIQINNIEESLKNLHDSIGVLETRLIPVMLESPPSTAEDESEKPESGSKVHCDLVNIDKRIGLTIEKIHDLESRLEI